MSITTQQKSITFENYKKHINNNQTIGDESDTNFFDSIHLSENDHTSILWQILQFKRHGQYPFLKSFVEEVLGLPYWQKFGTDNPLSQDSGTQHHAVSLTTNKNSGFIDLLLKTQRGYVFIIENKVCGAVDMKGQLLRYYFSFVKYLDSNKNYLLNNKYHDDFFKLCKTYYEIQKPTFYKADKVYVVYLTKDGKRPLSKSVGYLESKIGTHYIPISYFGDDIDGRKCILKWLKEDVLPNVPYVEAGTLLQSLILYVSYLENSLDDGGYVPYDKSLASQLGIEDTQVKDLIAAYRGEYRKNSMKISDYNSKEFEEERKRTKYLKFIKACINYKLLKIADSVNNKCNTDWIIRWAPSYIMLFKKEWFENFAHTSSICLMHWELLKNFTKEENFDSWDFHLEGPELKDSIVEVMNTLIPDNKQKVTSHIRGVFNKSFSKYILDIEDSEIERYFTDVFKNDDFIEKSKKAEKAVNCIKAKKET